MIMGEHIKHFSKKCSKNYYSKLDKSKEKFTKVFVKCSGGTLNEQNLEKWFGIYCGNVQSISIAKDDYGTSLRNGHVCFYRWQDAERAVQVANGSVVNGCTLSVQPYRNSDVPNRNVFVKGFGSTLDDKKLLNYFREIGDVESVKVAKDKDGVSKGYGYVCFFKPGDAVKAVRKINGRKAYGNTLTVEPFISKEERHKECNRNVYVKGFGKLDDDGLRKIFQKCGDIESVKIERDDFGVSKGYGYICFSRWQEAETAIHVMNGCKLDSKVITVCAFQSKEERQKNLKNRNLHIRNLHGSVNDKELRELFAPYGKILNACVDSSPIEGINQGHVCFETAEEADDAIAALHLSFYKNLKLKVCVHQNKKAREVEDLLCSFRPEKCDLPQNSGGLSYHSAKKQAYKDKSKSIGSLSQPKSRIAANLNQNYDQGRVVRESHLHKKQYSLQTPSAQLATQDFMEGPQSMLSLNCTLKPKQYSNTTGSGCLNHTEICQPVASGENVKQWEKPSESRSKNIFTALWNTP